LAIHKNRLDVVKLLVESGADVNRQDRLGGVPIVDAGEDHPEILGFLISRGAKYPAGWPMSARLRTIFEKQGAIEVGVKKDLPTPVPSIIKGFLGGAKPADKELFTAIEFQSVEGVKSALAHGADPNAVNPEDDNKTVSEYAFDIIDREISKEMIKALMKSGLSLTRKSEFSENTPLINAVHKGDVELVQMMIDAGSPVDVKGSEGGTALYWATDNMPLDPARAWPGAAERLQTIMKILLKAGANPQLVYDALEKYPEALAETKTKIERIRNPGMAIEVGVKKDLPTPLPAKIRGFLGASRRS
jgi:ankyrin repeat protein